MITYKSILLFWQMLICRNYHSYIYTSYDAYFRREYFHRDTKSKFVDFDWWFMIIQLIYLSCDIPSNRRNDLHHNFPMVVLTVPTILVRSQYCSFQRSPPKQYTAVSNNNREWLLASLPQLGKIVGKLRSICNVSDQTCE
jgi:hypothetical protein